LRMSITETITRALRLSHVLKNRGPCRRYHFLQALCVGRAWHGAELRFGVWPGPGALSTLGGGRRTQGLFATDGPGIERLSCFLPGGELGAAECGSAFGRAEDVLSIPSP